LLAGLVLLLARFARASRAERLRTWPVTAAGCALLTVGALPALAPDLSLGYVYGLAVAAVAVATIVQRCFPLNRDGIAGVAVELGRASGGRTLGGRLADAIGDPSLVVGYRLGAGYVDEGGRPLELPAPGDGRAITPILDRSVPIAVLIHDPASLDDPRLVEAVTSLARIAIANTELRASARARLADVEASRRRLLLAGDKQRRRFADDLEQGPERRLAAVAPLLRAAAPDLAAVATEIDADLRRLGSGLMPATLVEGGLVVALEELAARSPVPVRLEASRVDCESEIALAAYFVCAEALANVAKHARASTATVTVAAAGGHLRLAVADDGIGGADLRRGSGLRGLADRVEALGGSVSVTSPPGRGTALEVALPLAVTRS
jgi:signal transduction histidine kinase